MFAPQGLLENGMIAVKKLSKSYLYEKEFRREIECLIKVKHRNTVRFLGYCHDTQGIIASHDGKVIMAEVQERLLCFEYVPNGNLHKYITGRIIVFLSKYYLVQHTEITFHAIHTYYPPIGC